MSLISNDESLDPTGVSSQDAREFLSERLVEIKPDAASSQTKKDESNDQETVEDLMDMM